MSGNSTGRVPVMTAKNLTTMFLGEKKNRASILLCDRVETNSIKPVSQGKVTGQKPCIHAGLRRFNGHFHTVMA